MKPLLFIAPMVAAWCMGALIYGHFNLSRQLPFWGPPLIPVGLATLATMLVLSIKRLKRVVLAIHLDWLVCVAFLRLLAVYMIQLHFEHRLPGSLAWPAAIGAVSVAGLAALLLRYAQPLESRGRRWLGAWNILGFLQLVSVIVLVALHIVAGYGPELGEFASLPLNLFPTFLVPLSLSVHAVIHVRLYHAQAER